MLGRLDGADGGPQAGLYRGVCSSCDVGLEATGAGMVRTLPLKHSHQVVAGTALGYPNSCLYFPSFLSLSRAGDFRV